MPIGKTSTPVRDDRLSDSDDGSESSMTNHVAGSYLDDILPNQSGSLGRSPRTSQKANGGPPPMIVVSNRLPFVLKRKEDGLLERKARQDFTN